MSFHLQAAYIPQVPCNFTTMAIETPKADFDAVPTIDYSLAKTDRAAYFQQFKYACETVGFGVSLLFYLEGHHVTDSTSPGLYKRPRLRSFVSEGTLQPVCEAICQISRVQG